jgi:hypothetical protein
MKTGCCYINGTDIYTAYGAFVASGGYKSLFSYPSVKSVQTNDWMEHDGIEADMSALHVQAREVTVTFNLVFSHDWSGFVAFMIAGMTLDFAPAECCPWHFYLRYLGVSSFTPCYGEGITKMTVRFAEDMPWGSVGDVASGRATGVTVPNYKLDNVPFGNYGVQIIRGTRKDVLTPPDLKQYLVRSFSDSDGRTYDEPNEYVVDVPEYGVPREAGGTVTLQCLLTAKAGRYGNQDLTARQVFWWLYARLFHDLVAANQTQASSDPTTACMRTLVTAGETDPVTCHYRSSDVSSFYSDEGRYWCHFTISFQEVNNGV